ncbi:MAG: hypothetical protein ABR598_03620 [Candidatus Dormibacteria bacterium]
MSLWQRLILTRRYAPFLVLGVSQLVLVMVAPSVGLTNVNAPAGIFNPNGTDQGNGAQATNTPGGQGAAAGGAAGGSGGAAGGAGSGAGAAGGGPRTALGIPTTGDTSHCVGGKQFGDLTTAPPCVPKWPGGNNGGATYQGVTATSITVVYYREKDNPVVKQIEQQINVYSDPGDQDRFRAAAEKFINAKYEFYGRKLHLVFFQGSCDPSPPQEDCFRNDVRTLNTQYHPFGVIYENNTAIPWFFQEATRLNIVNMGGWHYGDNVFNIPQRPYHYDVYMGGDSQAQITAEYWCKKLEGKPARFAGDAVMKTKTRKLAVVTIDTPFNKPSAQHLVDLVNHCDPNGARLETYASDITTATTQANTTVHNLSTAGITSVFFFGDPIAPLYFTKACTSQQYFPEHVLVGSGLIDYDLLARLYDPQQWKHAFGPSDIPTSVSYDKSDGGIVWHWAGNTSTPYPGVNLPWSYFNLMANGLQAAGPHLTPQTLEYGAFNSPAINDYKQTHDQYHAQTVIRPGKYTAITDQREVYWDANATSPIDGKAGAYIPLNEGRRYAPGDWTTGEPTLPPGV